MAPAVAAAALWQALSTSSSSSDSSPAADSSSSSAAVITGGVQEWHALRVLQGIELDHYSSTMYTHACTLLHTKVACSAVRC
jgi:hypothetical protein